MRAPPKCNPTGGFFSFQLVHELIEPIRVVLLESEGVGFNLEANGAGSLGRDSQVGAKSVSYPGHYGEYIQLASVNAIRRWVRAQSACCLCYRVSII